MNKASSFILTLLLLKNLKCTFVLEIELVWIPVLPLTSYMTLGKLFMSLWGVYEFFLIFLLFYTDISNVLTVLLFLSLIRFLAQYQSHKIASIYTFHFHQPLDFRKLSRTCNWVCCGMQKLWPIRVKENRKFTGEGSPFLRRPYLFYSELLADFSIFGMYWFCLPVISFGNLFLKVDIAFILHHNWCRTFILICLLLRFWFFFNFKGIKGNIFDMESFL